VYFIEPIEVTNVFTSDPIAGMYYIAEPSPKAGRKGTIWWKMPVKPTDGPERIAANEVPRLVYRQATRYFTNQKIRYQRYLQDTVKWTADGWDKVA
jgi:hypothetical protein